MASRSRPGEGGRKIIRAPLVLILDRIILWGLLANSQKESGPRISTSDLIVCPRRKGKERLEKTKQAFLSLPYKKRSPTFFSFSLLFCAIFFSLFRASCHQGRLLAVEGGGKEEGERWRGWKVGLPPFFFFFLPLNNGAAKCRVKTPRGLVA